MDRHMAAADKTIKTRPIIRAFEITRGSSVVDEANRTVALSFSSEQPLYDEGLQAMVILDHGPGCCDLSRMEGGPVLVQHNPNDQIGAAENVRVEGRRGRAVARFSRSERGEEIFQDVRDGIRRLVSVRAAINKVVLEEDTNGVKTMRAVSWTPLEFSFVSIPADNSVGVGRNDQTQTVETLIQSTPQTTRSMQTEIEVTENAAGKERRKNIQAAATMLSQLHPNGAATFGAIAARALLTNISVEEANQQLLRAIPGMQEVESTPFIGMTDKEVKRFSLLRACREMSTRGRLSGLEKEACETAQKQMRRELKDPNSFVIPEEVCVSTVRSFNLLRGQSAGNFTAGGALVGEQYGPMIEFLRNQTILGRLGITVVSGLVGDFIMPVQTGGVTAYWVAEDGTLTDSAATFGQKAMVPHRLGATVPFTTQFLAQASISAEDLMRNELLAAMSVKKDLAGLQGSGVAGEPLGVLNTTGINRTVTYGGAATWADIVEHETGVAVDNADVGSMGFAVSAATIGKWKTILKDAVAGSGYLCEGAGENMTAGGFPAKRSNNISDSISFFGVWAQLMLGSWAGLEIIVDPYALKKSGQIEITMNELCDFLVKQPLSFNVSTDSAAQ